MRIHKKSFVLIYVNRCLDGLSNFAGAEDWENVASGVLSFGTSDLGRLFADACVRDLKTNYRGDAWGNNGPGVITRTLQKICGIKNVRIVSRSMNTFHRFSKMNRETRKKI